MCEQSGNSTFWSDTPRPMLFLPNHRLNIRECMDRLDYWQEELRKATALDYQTFVGLHEAATKADNARRVIKLLYDMLRRELLS